MDKDFFNKRNFQVCPYPRLNRRRYIPPPNSFFPIPEGTAKIDNLTCYRQAYSYCPRYELERNMINESGYEIGLGEKLDRCSQGNGFKEQLMKDYKDNSRHSMGKRLVYKEEENKQFDDLYLSPHAIVNDLPDDLDQRTTDILKHDLKNGFDNKIIEKQDSKYSSVNANGTFFDYPSRYENRYNNTSGLQAKMALDSSKIDFSEKDELYKYITANRRQVRNVPNRKGPRCYHDNLKQPRMPSLDTTEYKQHYVNYGKSYEDKTQPIYPADNLDSHNLCTAFSNFHNKYLFDY